MPPKGIIGLGSLRVRGANRSPAPPANKIVRMFSTESLRERLSGKQSGGARRATGFPAQHATNLLQLSRHNRHVPPKGHRRVSRYLLWPISQPKKPQWTQQFPLVWICASI